MIPSQEPNINKNHEVIALKIIDMLGKNKMTPFESMIILSTLASALEAFSIQNPDSFNHYTIEELMKPPRL